MHVGVPGRPGRERERVVLLGAAATATCPSGTPSALTATASPGSAGAPIRIRSSPPGPRATSALAPSATERRPLAGSGTENPVTVPAGACAGSTVAVTAGSGAPAAGTTR